MDKTEHGLEGNEISGLIPSSQTSHYLSDWRVVYEIKSMLIESYFIKLILGDEIKISVHKQHQR